MSGVGRISCGFCTLSERRLLQRLRVYTKTWRKQKMKAMSIRRERSMGLCPEGCPGVRVTSGSAKSIHILNMDEASPQLYSSLVLEQPESPGNSLSVSPDHGAQTLVSVMMGYLDVLAGHYPLSFTEKENEIR